MFDNVVDGFVKSMFSANDDKLKREKQRIKSLYRLQNECNAIIVTIGCLDLSDKNNREILTRLNEIHSTKMRQIESLME